ncbi:MAG: RNA polymerase sigma factor [Bacteroidaceae bacterium]|nr:RNA polymerase sigma factor [Bacteroidaceae bacterium]
MMNEQVFIEEVRRLRPQMLRVAIRYLEDADWAEDVVQDALLKLWTMHRMIPQPMDRLAFTVLKHRCLGELRRRENARKADDVSLDCLDMPDQDADEIQAVEERERELVAAVDRLPSRQRTLLRMHYFEGTGYERIARIMGSTEANVRQQMRRARNAVYKALAAVAVACVGLAFAVSELIRWNADRRFNERYEGSCMIVDGKCIDNPKEMQSQIEDLLSLADALEREMQVDAFAIAENDVLKTIDDPEERERIKALLNP